MSAALVMQAAGRRENGKWKHGTAKLYESVKSESGWSVRLSECGVILDYLPDLAPEVVSGATKLSALSA